MTIHQKECLRKRESKGWVLVDCGKCKEKHRMCPIEKEPRDSAERCETQIHRLTPDTPRESLTHLHTPHYLMVSEVWTRGKDGHRPPRRWHVRIHNAHTELCPKPGLMFRRRVSVYPCKWVSAAWWERHRLNNSFSQNAVGVSHVTGSYTMKLIIGQIHMYSYTLT